MSVFEDVHTVLCQAGSWDENKLNLRSSFRNVKPSVSGKSVYGPIGFGCAKA